MNPVLNWLGTKGKERMAEHISAEASAHPMRDELEYLVDFEYKGADGASLAADVYRPKGPVADPLPVAVFVHGGGLFVGSRKSNRLFAEQLAMLGYVVVVPEYRLISEADGPHEIADVCACLAYVASNAQRLGGDLERVLLIGESAGAFLALYAAALLGSPQLSEALNIESAELNLRGFASFAGMLYTSRNDPIGLTYRRDLFGARLRDAAFMELVNPEDPRVESYLPPVFLVTSGADFLKSYTLRYSRALAMIGHDHRLVYYAKGKELTHAFPSLKPDLPQSGEVLNELDKWFRNL